MGIYQMHKIGVFGIVIAHIEPKGRYRKKHDENTHHANDIQHMLPAITTIFKNIATAIIRKCLI
jgi:hypothetical protein